MAGAKSTNADLKMSKHDVTKKNRTTTMTTSNSGRTRARSTSHDGVPDLTPHINDPLEHLRNIFKGFCTFNLGEDENRSPPVVTRDTIRSKKLTRAPEVCGFLCLDSHSKELEPCLPCKCEEEAVDDSSVRNGHERAILILEKSSVSGDLDDDDDDWEIIDMMNDDDKPARRIMDSLMATVLALFVAVHALRSVGYSFDMSIDAKSFAESQLASSVMGEPFVRNDDDALENEVAFDCDTSESEEEAGAEELQDALNDSSPIGDDES